MADHQERIPHREGEKGPAGYVLATMVNDDGTEKGQFWVRPESIKDAPIRHENVDDLLPVIRWMWRHIGKRLHWCRSFEDWELGFMRDTNPDREVAYWMKATYAFLEFTHRNPTANKAAVWRAIMALMVGRDDMVKPKSLARKLAKLASNPLAVLAKVSNFTADGKLKTDARHLR